MKFLLNRYFEGPYFTCGHLFQEIFVPTEAGQEPPKSATEGCPQGFHRAWDFVCDTLEPPLIDSRPDRKVARAIPEGNYPLVVSHSPKFQRQLPLLLNVPGRSGIRIHAGNRAHLDPAKSDTTGCILVGSADHTGHLIDSRRALAVVMKRLAERPEGEGVRVKVGTFFKLEASQGAPCACPADPLPPSL
jgi:hypothetical protein